MKTRRGLLIVLLLLISGTIYAQYITCWTQNGKLGRAYLDSIVWPTSGVGKLIVSQDILDYPRDITFSSQTHKSLNFNLQSDTLKVSGNLELDSAAVMFLDWLDIFYSGRVATLRRENEILRNKLNLIGRMAR